MTDQQTIEAPEKDKTGHIVELQSMRGLAALAVLLSHTLNYYSGLPEWFIKFRSLAFNGQGSVVLFFVLSGFVLARSLISGKSDSVAGTAAFYVKRLFRIYPAVFVASVIALIFIHFFKHAAPDQTPWYLAAYPKTIGTVAVIASFLAAANFLIPPLWSVTVELFGSVLMPFFTRAARLRPIWLTTILIGLAVISATIGPKTPLRVLIYPFDFAAGAALCSPFIIGSTFWTRMRRVLPYLFVTSAALLMVTRNLLALTNRSPVGNFIETALAVLMVGSVAYGGVRFRFLTHKITTWFGNISYSTYLVHFSIMGIAGVLLPVDPSRPIAANLLLTATVLLVTSPIATMLYYGVEKPGELLGRIILKHTITRR